jgi:acyl-CoA reductase-like NAD-dependent aldehyde dehydrogenase
MEIRNPATTEVLSEVAEDSPAAVLEKYGRARSAQPIWAATPLATRLAAIARFRDLLSARKDELALTLTREMGKPITQAMNELSAMPGRIDFFLENTEATLREETVLGAGPTTEIIGFEPLGVIANVSAWNYPWFVGSNVFVPALLAGNTVLYKPSEHATLTGLAIAALLHEAGVHEDAFLPVVGRGEVGAALLDQPVDGVFFTGSYGTGKRIVERVAPRLVRVQLELGGKDPVYVSDDADIGTAAASLADGAMYNTGQSCCSVERIYVHERVADAFTNALVEAVRGFPVGDPEDPATYFGPLAREAQLAILDAQVADAISKGAKVLLGGQRAKLKGYYFEPTVLSQATNTMHVMREESFGPIIGIASVKDDEEAVRLMNDTEYGLTAGVYGRDSERARQILKGVNTGSAYFNCCDRVSPRLPWTGRRNSGIGSTLSKLGILAFVQPKAWHLRMV